MFRKRAPKPYCSFCNRAEDAAGELISSPINEHTPPPDHFVYICADCVAVCNQLLSDRHEEAEGAMPEKPSLISEASGNERNDEVGPVVLPNGVPLHLPHWVRRTSRHRS